MEPQNSQTQITLSQVNSKLSLPVLPEQVSLNSLPSSPAKKPSPTPTLSNSQKPISLNDLPDLPDVPTKKTTAADLLNDPQIMFPHDTMRDGQSNLVKDIKSALHNEKILLAHAPTGLGKTASALSVAVPLAKKLKKKVFFLTNRHTQHKIAIDTLQAMQLKSGESIVVSDIIGKKSMCAQEVAKLFGSDFNDYCKSLTEKGKCSYYTKVKDKKGTIIIIH